MRRISAFTHRPGFALYLKGSAIKNKELFRAVKIRICGHRTLSYWDATTNYRNVLCDAKRKYFNTPLLVDNTKIFSSINNTTESRCCTSNYTFGFHTQRWVCCCAKKPLCLPISNYQNSGLPVFPEPNIILMDLIRISCYCIVKITESMTLSSSAGADNANAKFLKGTKEYSSTIVSEIF